MMRLLHELFRDKRAASAAEFALVLPLLLILMFGIIDMGRFFWQLNESEKATQMGARLAVVTTPVSPDLVGESYVDGTTKKGDLIPADALGTLTCNKDGCTCKLGTCPGGSCDVDSDAFDVIVTRMAQMNPQITADNVEVSYSGSGFGYAGDADENMDVQPLVTVTLKDMQFNFIALLGLIQVNMPAASATLTAEDSSGTFSN